jgi:hypothetical protein
MTRPTYQDVGSLEPVGTSNRVTGHLSPLLPGAMFLSGRIGNNNVP